MQHIMKGVPMQHIMPGNITTKSCGNLGKSFPCVGRHLELVLLIL